MAMAFPHHAVQEKAASGARRNCPRECAQIEKRGTPWRRVRTLSRRPRRRYSPTSPTRKPSTATRKAAGRLPLWQALSEAGLPLSWVPEDCGGSGASLAEGLQRVERGRAFRDCGAARRNHAGGLAAGASQNRFARRRDDRGAGQPERPHRTRRRRHPVRPRARRSVRQGRRTFCGAGAGRGGSSIALVDAGACRIEAGLNLASDGNDTVTFNNVQPAAIKPAPKGFDQTSLMLMGAVARSLQIAGAWNRCSTSACVIPTSASRSRRRSRNSRRCSTISRGWPERPRRR